MYTCVHANMEGRGVHPGSSIILHLGFQLRIPSFFLICLCVCVFVVCTHPCHGGKLVGVTCLLPQTIGLGCSQALS